MEFLRGVFPCYTYSCGGKCKPTMLPLCRDELYMPMLPSSVIPWRAKGIMILECSPSSIAGWKEVVTLPLNKSTQRERGAAAFPPAQVEMGCHQASKDERSWRWWTFDMKIENDVSDMCDWEMFIRTLTGEERNGSSKLTYFLERCWIATSCVRWVFFFLRDGMN